MRSICFSIAILAFLAAHINGQQVCNADMVFMIDSSDNPGVGNMFEAFYTALNTFANNQQQIASNAIRVGAVYYTDTQSNTIPLTGQRSFLINQINANQFRLGGGIRHRVGLEAANSLFNSGRTFTPRIAILVTPSRSLGGATPFTAINELKANTGGSSMTVYTLGLPLFTNTYMYSSFELNQIATGNYRNISIANLLNEFYSIAATACTSVVATTTTTSPVSSNVCDNCDVENGVGYKTHPSSCRRFIQCKKDDFSDTIIAYDKLCNDGLYWNQKLKNCVPFPLGDCYKGECDAGSYVFDSMSCGAYFNCTNGIVTTGCCPRNTPAFDATSKTCVASSTCEYHCEDDARTSRNLQCQNTYKPFTYGNNLINPCKYTVHETGSVKEMSCPAGTNWNALACDCSLFSSDPCPQQKIVNPCDPDFSLKFNGNVVKDLAGGAWIDNYGSVAIRDESATFNGLLRQRLAVNRYSNIDFGLPLAIKLRYRDSDAKNNMAVLSTGGCIDRPGVYITAGNGRVTLGVVTAGRGYSSPVETSATTAGTNQWKEVVLFYDGMTLSGIVRTINNGVIVGNGTPIPSVPVSSNIERILTVDGALQFGYAHNSGFPGFVGQIDEVKIWLGCETVRRPGDF